MCKIYATTIIQQKKKNFGGWETHVASSAGDSEWRGIIGPDSESRYPRCATAVLIYDSSCTRTQPLGLHRRQARNPNRVYWGDSLLCTPPRMLLESVVATLIKVNGESWSVSTQKYITDILHFESQRNGYSCSLYVVCTSEMLASHRLVSSCAIPGNAYSHYSAQMTEIIRKCCVEQFVAALVEVEAQPRRRPSWHGNAHRYLSLLIESKGLLHRQRFVPAAPPGDFSLSDCHARSMQT